MSRVMFKHHQETIDRVVDEFKAADYVLAVVVGGSVAHGFATETSDVDIMLLVDNEEYESRLRTGNLTYFNREICTYEGGYVDGKYITMDFLRQVAEKGSEPARFAFKDAFVAFSRVEGLEDLLATASRYPVEYKSDRIRKLYAQFEAWKWFMRVLEQVEDKPVGLTEQINLVLQRRNDTDIDALYAMIIEFRDWGCDRRNWANRFMLDTELSWMRDAAPVADL